MKKDDQLRLVQMYLTLAYTAAKLVHEVYDLLNIAFNYFIMNIPNLENPRWTTKFRVKLYSWVFVPTDNNIKYGKFVKKAIEEKWQPPRNYYHLRDGGHVRALKSHLQNKYFIRLDISNFFGSINRTRITRCVKQIFSYDISRRIAIDSTVRLPEVSEIRYILPFGFIQSPIIASLCLYHSRLGSYLENLGRKGLMVSVYMDDIIISGDNEKCLHIILEEIRGIADKAGFPLNLNKEEGPSHRITAFNIHLSHNYLEITQDRMEEFSEAFYLAENDAQREGIIGYIKTVNPAQVNQL